MVVDMYDFDYECKRDTDVQQTIRLTKSQKYNQELIDIVAKQSTLRTQIDAIVADLEGVA